MKDRQKVEYFKYVRKPDAQGINQYVKVKGTAMFLEFGSDCEEGGTFSTAIIKLEDGSLKNISVEMIRFIETD
jgi:hypothetical protein